MSSNQSRITKHAKRQEKTSQNENTQSIKTDSELTQMLKLINKDIKVITSMLHMFKKISRDKEDLKNGTSRLINYIPYDKKYAAIKYEIYGRLDTAEEKNERLMNLRI